MIASQSMIRPAGRPMLGVESLDFAVLSSPRQEENARPKAERRIADGLRERDPQALSAAYDAYGGTIFGYLVKVIGDRPAAEDVQQQVFLEVWQRGEGYDPERAGLFTWIMTIARSRAIDHLRKRIPTPHDPASPVALAEAAEAGPDSPDQLAERWRVAEVLRRIPPEESELLRMRFYRELSQREIAEETGMPLGTVKMRMVRAFERLRELIESEGRA